MIKFDWQPRDAGFVAEIGNVTISAYPDRINYGRPKRGTKWHAQCSIWDEKTRTISRYGKDIYCTLFNTAKEAKAAAEEIYENELNKQ